jgi:hypothetical protein
MIQVGENIDAYCSKCKMLLAHIIMVKIEGTVHKVKCKTCGAEHKYRLHKSAVKKVTRKQSAMNKGAVRKTGSVKIDNSNEQVKWEMKSRDLDRSLPINDYSIHTKYSTKDVINHSKFGLGFVERIVTDKSMNVLFCDSVKLMAMNIS